MPRRTESDGRSLKPVSRQCYAVSAATLGPCVRKAMPVAQMALLLEMWNWLKLAYACATISDRFYLDLYQGGTLLPFTKPSHMCF